MVCKWQDYHSWVCKLRSLWLCQALVPNGEKLSFHFLSVENSAKPIKLVGSDRSGAVSRPEGRRQLFGGAGGGGDPIGEGGLKFNGGPPLED